MFWKTKIKNGITKKKKFIENQKFLQTKIENKKITNQENEKLKIENEKFGKSKYRIGK